KRHLHVDRDAGARLRPGARTRLRPLNPCPRTHRGTFPNRRPAMKKLLAALLTSAALATSAMAQDITEFRIGILGGENAQDRMTSNECVRAYVQELLGVETKIFT